MPEDVRVQHLIVGGSAAAVAAVEAIREFEGARGASASSIAVVSEEPYPPYARHLISYYLTGEREGDLLAYRPADFWLRQRVQAYLGFRVVAVDMKAREARLHRIVRSRALPVGLPEELPEEMGRAGAGAEDPLIIRYETLLFATGGRPIAPPLTDPGVASQDGDGRSSTGEAGVSADGGEVDHRLAPGLTFFTTLDDAIGVRRAVARGVRRVVVVGGGLIGLQVAEALLRLGAEVEIVELMPRLLGPVLDEEAAARVETLARQAGVKVRTGVSVTAVERDGAGRLTGVILADGQRLAADLVILAAGVRPRLELARAAGLLCDRGVVLVRGAETSVAGVFAAGDVAQGWDMAAGLRRPLPTWSNAVFQGRRAGRQMAARLLGLDPDEPDWEFSQERTGKNGSPKAGGSDRPDRPFAGLMLNAAHFFGLPLVSVGVPNPPPGDSQFTVVSWQAGRVADRTGRQTTPDRSGVVEMLARHGWDYRKLVFRDGRLVGLLAAGPSVAGAGAIAGLIWRGVSIDADTTGEALVRKWDWSVLPRALRQELLWEMVSEEGASHADGDVK